MSTPLRLDLVPVPAVREPPCLLWRNYRGDQQAFSVSHNRAQQGSSFSDPSLALAGGMVKTGGNAAGRAVLTSERLTTSRGTVRGVRRARASAGYSCASG